MEVERKSRVARALSQLEPSDVLKLREMVDSANREARGVFQHEPSRLAMPAAMSYSYDALRAAGCTVTIEGAMIGSTFSQLHVSALGRDVVRAVEDWMPEGVAE